MTSEGQRAKDLMELLRDEIGDQLPDSLVGEFREAWKAIAETVTVSIREEMEFHGDERFEDGKADGYDDGYEAGLEEAHDAKVYGDVGARRAARILDGAGLTFLGVRTDTARDDERCLVVEMSEGDLEVMRRRLTAA